MSKSDDRTDNPAYSRGLNGLFANRQQDSVNTPNEEDPKYGLNIDPRLNDQSEYSQVGGKRINNQPYPALGQQQNPNKGTASDNAQLDGQGGYPPLDNQNDYSQPYDPLNSGNAYPQPGQQYPDSPYQQQGGYNQPAPGGDQYGMNQGGAPSYGNYGGQADGNYSQPQQGYPNQPSGHTDYNNYPSNPGYDHNQYSYPTDNAPGQESYDGYNDGGFPSIADQNNYYDQSPQADDAYFDDQFEAEDYHEQPKRKSSIPTILMSIIALAGIGAGGYYAYDNNLLPIGTTNANTGGAPVLISKDSTPFKERPSQPGGRDFPNRGKLIYDRLSGKSNTGQAQKEKLVPRVEKLVNAPKAENNTGIPGVSVGNTASLQPRSTGGTGQTNARQKPKINKVKIIPVRPDGSFGNSVPGISLGNDTLPERPRGVGIAAVNNLSAGSSSTQQQTRTTIGNALPAIKKPEPKAQPQPVKQIQKPQRTAALQPQKPVIPQQPISTAAASDTTGYAVQVAARRNQTDALIAFANMQQKYPTILNQFQPLIQKADLTAQGKGVWYRLRIGPMTSRDAATTICSRLKAEGVKACFVKKL